MAEAWGTWLLILGVLLLIIGIVLTIWAVQNKRTYWYFALIAGIGLLLLFFGFIVYAMGGSAEPSCHYVSRCAEPGTTRETVYCQPVIDGCGELEEPCEAPRHIFYATPPPIAAPQHVFYQQPQAPAIAAPAPQHTFYQGAPNIQNVPSVTTNPATSSLTSMAPSAPPQHVLYQNSAGQFQPSPILQNAGPQVQPYPVQGAPQLVRGPARPEQFSANININRGPVQPAMPVQISQPAQPTNQTMQGQPIQVSRPVQAAPQYSRPVPLQPVPLQARSPVSTLQPGPINPYPAPQLPALGNLI